LLLVSAGFDAHRDDNMPMLKLTEADYSWVTAKLKPVTEKYAHGRIVSALECGYELQALSQSALSHIKVLSGL
jgi:acetoin utilization deacetylase AcuC-like enzyme